MPRKEDLPEALALLSRRNAIELSEIRFRADVNRLIEAIEKSLAVAEEKAELSSGRTEAVDPLTAEYQAHLDKLSDPTTPDEEILSPTELGWLAQILNPEERRKRRDDMVADRARLSRQVYLNLKEIRYDPERAQRYAQRRGRQRS